MSNRPANHFARPAPLIGAIVIVVSLAQRGARPLPTLLLATAITLGACVVFVLLLGLQIPLFPRF